MCETFTHCSLCGSKQEEREIASSYGGRYPYSSRGQTISSVQIRSIKDLPLCADCDSGLCGGKYSAVALQSETASMKVCGSFNPKKKPLTLIQIMQRHETAAQLPPLRLPAPPVAVAEPLAEVEPEPAAPSEVVSPVEPAPAPIDPPAAPSIVRRASRRTVRRITREIDDSPRDWKDTARRLSLAAYV